MRKMISSALCAVMVLTLCGLSGCGEKYDGEINVYNFGVYIDNSTWENFEKEFNIKVNYSTYETCESLYSVMKNGGAEYDVIITSDYMIARMAEEDMLAELDFGNIPNYSLIGDRYKNLSCDPDGLYSVPYMWGTFGIIYNPELVTGDFSSWSAMFDERYSGQILMFDSTRDAFAVALLALGYDLNTTDEGEIREAYELLKAQSEYVQGYFQDQQYDKLEVGEASVGVYYAGDYLCMTDNNPNLRFSLPKEGSNWFVDSMAVPATSEKKELSEKFINYMCRTDVALANMGATGYASPNTEACEEYAKDLDSYSAAIMFPDAETLSRCTMYDNLPQETLDLYDSLWIKIKS